MKKNIITLLAMAGLSISSISFAEEKTGNLKTSAKLEHFCTISADNINFGMVAAPLLMQTSSSPMNVFCTKSTTYNISLSYGGVYGQGGVNSAVYSTTVVSSTSDSGVRSTDYRLYKDGVPVGSLSGSDFRCDGRGGSLALYVSSQGAKNAFNLSSTGWQSDSIGICGNKTGYVNPATLAKLGGAPAYDYGVMKGLFKGDNLAYKITVPGDANKVWNQGKNTYSGVGTGEEQTIDMNTTIVPDKSSTKYIAQDNYVDTVTATISY